MHTPQSIASERTVVSLARMLGQSIPEFLRVDPDCTWTWAVWRAFERIRSNPGGEIELDHGNALAYGRSEWALWPQKGPYKGEYLLDFVLWESGYGPRILCESQWHHGFSAIGAIDWAFDKLRCVKGDIKVLIYEVSEQPNGSQPPDTVAEIVTGYLKELALLSNEEAFLLLNFNDHQKWAHWWKPVSSGSPAEIRFTPIDLAPR